MCEISSKMQDMANLVDKTMHAMYRGTTAERTWLPNLLFKPCDITGTGKSNHIVDEVHKVNSGCNNHVIKPYVGYFFGESMKIKHANRIMEFGTDYIFGGHSISPDSGNTGIYEYIILLEDHVEPLILNYQAVGTCVTEKTIGKLKELLTSLNTEANVDTVQQLLSEAIETATPDKNTFKLLDNDGESWYSIGEVRTGYGIETFEYRMVIETPGCNPITVAANFCRCNHIPIMSVSCNNAITKIKNTKQLIANDYSKLFKLRVLWDMENSAPSEYNGLLQIKPLTTTETLTLNIVNLSIDNIKLFDIETGVFPDLDPKLPSGKSWVKDVDNNHYAWKLVGNQKLFTLWSGELVSDDIMAFSKVLEPQLDSVVIPVSCINHIHFKFVNVAGEVEVVSKQHTRNSDVLYGHLQTPCGVDVTYSIASMANYIVNFNVTDKDMYTSNLVAIFIEVL